MKEVSKVQNELLKERERASNVLHEFKEKRELVMHKLKSVSFHIGFRSEDSVNIFSCLFLLLNFFKTMRCF